MVSLCYEAFLSMSISSVVWRRFWVRNARIYRALDSSHRYRRKSLYFHRLPIRPLDSHAQRKLVLRQVARNVVLLLSHTADDWRPDSNSRQSGCTQPDTCCDKSVESWRIIAISITYSSRGPIMDCGPYITDLPRSEFLTRERRSGSTRRTYFISLPCQPRFGRR
jgi:hypothetical protein